MLDYRLSKQELAELRAANRRALNVREAYRINAVIVLGNGRTAADVADALLIDPETVRTYFKRYKKGGVEGRIQGVALVVERDSGHERRLVLGSASWLAAVHATENGIVDQDDALAASDWNRADAWPRATCA